MTDVRDADAVTALASEARLAAHVDERRLGAGTGQRPPSQRSAETLQSWADAALRRLEWRSHHAYLPAQRGTYRDWYAEAFRQARAARTARWQAAVAGGVPAGTAPSR